jgi:hypothetical protein
MVGLAALGACSYLPFMAAKPPPPMRPSATLTPTTTPTPTPTATPEPIKHKQRHKRPVRLPTLTPGPTATPMAAAPGAGGTVITTGEPVAERGEIKRDIQTVESQLAAIKRDRLGAADAADYDRIKSFIADARSALQEQDDLRARSLMDKATRLAAQLAGRVSSP